MLLLILALLLQPTVSLYHSTDFILQKFSFYCILVPELTCEWHDDILVVDYLKDKPRDQFWVMNEHARERITAELAFHVIRDIVNMKPDRRITIIPILNVWGRRTVEEGNTCLRKNKNGVDTNRNYQLGEKHEYDPTSEEYEGPHPLSEPESQLVSSILLSGVQRYINIHSGEFSMYMPYDSNASPPPHAETMRHFLRVLQPLCPECVEGSAGKVSTYKAFGTSVDFAIKSGIPEAYTFEIFGDVANSCEEMFNPIKHDTFSDIIDKWKKILLATVIDEALSQAPIT